MNRETFPEGFIPFNKPSIEGREMEHIAAAVAAGHTSADGPYSKLVVELLKDETGAADVLLTTSCTAALEMAAILLDVGPGDTVVAPSFGFVTTALSFVRQGAKILFCDIDPDTLALDPAHVAELMDETVRAVVPIHYAGIAGDVGALQAVVDRWERAELVEDNAQGLFARHHGRPLGSFGRFSTYSFHETKNFICGEGGALVVNDPADVDRAHVVYDKGTNRRAFLHGHVDKYSWRDVGSSFGLSDVLAAYLWGQLEQRDAIMAKRRHVFDTYVAALTPAEAIHGIRLPHVPAHSEQAYHIFHVLLPDAETRAAVMKSMNDDGIYATFHYVPLHDSVGGRAVAARPTECPVSIDVSRRLLRLPFYTSLADDDLDRIVASFLAALERHT